MTAKSRLCALTTLAAMAAFSGQAGGEVDGADCPDASLQPDETNLDRVEAAMVCLLNKERRRAGLEPLVVDWRLERSSASHTKDMTTRGYFSHNERGRPTLYERIRAAGFFKRTRSALYSENLGYGPPEYASALGMHRAFMSSEGHRINILFRRFRRVGIGSEVIGPNPAFYPDHPAAVYTIDFGRRYVRRTRRCVRPRASSTDTSAPPKRARSAPPRSYCERTG